MVGSASTVKYINIVALVGVALFVLFFYTSSTDFKALHAQAVSFGQCLESLIHFNRLHENPLASVFSTASLVFPTICSSYSLHLCTANKVYQLLQKCLFSTTHNKKTHQKPTTAPSQTIPNYALRRPPSPSTASSPALEASMRGEAMIRGGFQRDFG